MNYDDYLDERADWMFRDRRNDAMVPAISQEPTPTTQQPCGSAPETGNG
jgi:hypothetical protein